MDALTNLLCAVVCLGLIAAIVVGIVFLVQKNRKDRERAARPVPKDPFADNDSDALRGDPRRLKAGDLFDTHGETLAVRGTLRLKEGGYYWSEHLIDTGGGVKRWLSVEEDPDLELYLWTAVSGELPAPGAQYIDYDGRRFMSKESGRARYKSEATTGLGPEGYVNYHDYEASDGIRMSFEDFDQTGRSEVAIGLRIHRSEIMIYPQSQ